MTDALRFADVLTPDEALMARLANGDVTALELVFDRWCDHIHALVTRMVGHSAGVEAIVEEVFLQAARRAPAYSRHCGTPCSWLMVLARAQADVAIRATTRPDSDALLHARQCETFYVEDLLQDVPSSDCAGRVFAALDTLSNDDRELLEAVYFDGRDLSQLARTLSMPSGEVATRLRLALRTLRDDLKWRSGVHTSNREPS